MGRLISHILLLTMPPPSPDTCELLSPASCLFYPLCCTHTIKMFHPCLISTELKAQSFTPRVDCARYFLHRSFRGGNTTTHTFTGWKTRITVQQSHFEQAVLKGPHKHTHMRVCAHACACAHTHTHRPSLYHSKEAYCQIY